MFALFSLIALIVKIAVLASIYGAIVLLIFGIIYKVTKNEWVGRRLKRKLFLWWITGFIYSICSFVFAFSYWGDRGFGDFARIPIGYGYEVKNIDGSTTYFEDEKGSYSRQAFLKKFTVKDHTLCAEFEGFNITDCKDCFIVFDAEKSKMTEFKSEKEYAQYAINNKLPLRVDFKEFDDIYNDYWDGWKFWL